MSAPDLKTLKKLAAACRKAGITHFKSPDFEFSLAPEVPQAKVVGSRQVPQDNDPSVLTAEDEVLSPEAMMFWSVADAPPGSET